jgi:hypothetical protein
MERYSGTLVWASCSACAALACLEGPVKRGREEASGTRKDIVRCRKGMTCELGGVLDGDETS